MEVTELSDEELVARLDALCVEERRLLARLLLHLIEVEERRLHLKAACPTIFEFCRRRLGMTEGAAFRRMTAARLVRQFPKLVHHIECGDLHLSNLVLLRDHLTETNFDELVAAVSGKSKREVEALIARRAPRPDVAATLRKLPAPATPPAPAPAPATPTLTSAPSDAPTRPPPPPARARIETLSDARYKLQLTASAELRDKLERARDLMRHGNPSGDLAIVVERAVDALLEKLEKQTRAKTTRPPRTPPHPSTRGRVPRAVRREVFERDGEQCTFVDNEGHRCASRTFLELDHVASRALGGSSEAANLRVLCRQHNHHHAEEVFGKQHVASRIHFRRRQLLPNPPPSQNAKRRT